MHSLLSKMDMIKVWVKSTVTDVAVISQIWLTKSVIDKDINMEGYNVYCAERPKKVAVLLFM